MGLCSEEKTEMKCESGEERRKLVVLRGVVECLRKITFLPGTAWHGLPA